MANAKVVITGCKHDTPSQIRAGEILNMLNESNPGRKFMDYRKTEGGRECGGGKGFSSLFDLLIDRKIDIVIADASAIPLKLPPILEIGAVPIRGNPFNVLISAEDLILEEQPDNIMIAVSDQSSLGQLLYYRNDLLLVQANGGYQSMSSMMTSGEIGGFVINAVEVEALGRQENVVEVFTSSICMPVAGQGALGLIIRKSDRRMKPLVETVDDAPSRAEIMMERMFLSALGGNSRGAVSVLGKFLGEEFQINAVITAVDGSEKLSGTMHGWAGEERNVARRLAEQLLEAGGKSLINAG